MEIAILPKFLLDKLWFKRENQRDWNVILSSALLLLVFFVYADIDKLNPIPHFCLFKRLMSYPCPACGITRSIESVYSLRFMEAISYNPIGILILISVIVQIPLRVASLFNKLSLNDVEMVSSIIDKIVFGSLFLFWIFQIYIQTFKY